MKENGNIIVAALFIALGLFLGGMQINKGIKSTQDSQRVVSVKGLSEKEVAADRVTWPILFKEADNDLVTLYNKIEKNNAKVINFLKANGISDAEIIISPPDIIDYQTERYMSQDYKYRYNGTSIITVSSNHVDNIRVLIPQISQLIKEGVAIAANRQYDNPVNYSFTGLNDIKPTLIEEATKNARSTAEKFATDSQSKLGKIKSASQGQISISDRDENSPHIKQVRVVSTITYYL
ncbi:SIMPL domain-containing protein, partial [Bacteroidales bacterium OttesenSCG-928-M11]|nr:SIMPL domain-containing protein [Bacteroidales bacterium OttesenSCG-928-M11]